MNDTELQTNKKIKWTENLPKPPVPSLQITIERYLAGLQPVIPCTQFEQTKQTAQTFLGCGGEGEQLQELLTEYAQQADNWMTDFWLDDMYLTSPLPLVINSNPFFLLPKQTFKTTSEQIHFASVISHFALRFKDQIDRESINQDVGVGQKKDQKLCMDTYRRFFAAYRTPGESKDDLVMPKGSQHFVVASFNQFYAVYLENGIIPNAADLAKCFHLIWNSSKANKYVAHSVGILTADNRKTWATTRKLLVKDITNKESLECIEKCLFVLCLDDCVYPKVPTKTGYRNSIQIAKMDLPYMASMLLHGGGSNLHTANRWFDKFLQIVVSKEGICGLLIEHSASEGVTVLKFCELFLQYCRQQSSQLIRQSSVEMQDNLTSLKSVALKWNIDNQVAKQIKHSEKTIDKLILDLDFYVLKFAEFGQVFIKEQRMSPDVFIQLALQLTYYKLHRRLVSTYESCSLRQFRKGRVDNIRAATKEALAWSRSMCGEFENISETEKINLFKQAICKQTEILKYTSAGYGPDNHLIALREISKMRMNSVPQLFKEKSFKEYINFRLSTSQLFTLEDILIGYGPVVPDGYGCCYMPKKDQILFCLSSFYSSDETSSDFFALSLEGSLLQMREFCLKIQVETN